MVEFDRLDFDFSAMHLVLNEGNLLLPMVASHPLLMMPGIQVLMFGHFYSFHFVSASVGRRVVGSSSSLTANYSHI